MISTELRNAQKKVWNLTGSEEEFILMPIRLIVDGIECSIFTNRLGGIIATNSLIPDRLFYYFSIEKYVETLQDADIETEPVKC